MPGSPEQEEEPSWSVGRMVYFSELGHHLYELLSPSGGIIGYVVSEAHAMRLNQHEATEKRYSALIDATARKALEGEG